MAKKTIYQAEAMLKELAKFCFTPANMPRFRIFS